MLREPEQILKDRFPAIEWEEPLPCNGFGGEQYGLSCRFCTALWGLHGKENPDGFADQPHLLTHVTKLPKSRDDFDRHMRYVHHRWETMRSD